MSATLQHQAQELGALLPPLLIEAERVAAVVMQGVHGRRRAGIGETFWQFRRYEQGDPAERIDWRQSSRTDKIFIREREWEAAQSAYVWADTSGSMQYSSHKKLPTKAERAQLLMLSLASLLLRGGEKVTWLDRRKITAHGKHGLENIVVRMGSFKGDSLPPDIPIARHAQVILCSDFLMPPDVLQNLLRRYAALQLRGVMLHILDPLENNFALEGRIEIEGCEGETSLLVPNAASLREPYQQRMAAHKENLARTAKGAGWHYMQHVTNTLPHIPLMQLYENLADGQRSL
ncbi:MAG: DUF58 domain-containing protein [Alphaproteobacteria bacterium]